MRGSYPFLCVCVVYCKLGKAGLIGGWVDIELCLKVGLG